MTTRILALLCTALFVASCATPPATPEEAMLRAHNPRLKVTRATDETRFPPFDRIMLAPLEMDFRPSEPLAGPNYAPQSRTDFPVSDRDRQRIAEDFTEIFREELGGSTHFALTEQPGPGVLLLKPALRDVVSRRPPEELPGRSDVYLDSVGDATLVVYFVDAATGQTLGYTSDRRTAEPFNAYGDFGAVRSDRVATGQEIRRLLRRWATGLDKRVEQLYFEAKPR